MVTGIGTVAPADVHIPAFRLRKESVAGGLVDGPVQETIFASLKGVSLSRPDAFAPFQSAEAVYHDDWQDYSTNEPTMDGTASAVLLMALQGRYLP
jgi:endoglucanase